MLRFFSSVLIGIFLLLISIQPGWADTFYVANNPSNVSGWGNGSNSNNGLSKTSPFLTFQHAIDQMSSGDELIIADGTYSGSGNLIDSASVQEIPSGTAGAYTIIRAENDGEVLIDGLGTNRCIYINGNDVVDGNSEYLSSWSQEYIQIQGIICANGNGGNISVAHSNHIKLINVGSVDPGDENASGISISYSTDCLIEGGYAWGGGRYKFMTYHTTRTVLRNCVARFDRANPTNEPIGSYSIYSSGNVEVQNCIDIDGGPSSYYQNYSNVAGSFTVPTTTNTAFRDQPINFTNVIALNTNMRFGMSTWNAYPANTFFNNAVGWNIYSIDNDSAPGGNNNSFFHSQGNVSFNHCTFGNVTNDVNNVLGGYFHGWKDGNTNSIANSIIHNFQEGDIFYDWENVSYSNITDLSSGRTLIARGTTNVNPDPPLSYNPLGNGLTRLTDIDAGSVLATAGKGGTYIGARIVKMYGKPGTLWGENGYNKLQDGSDGQENIDLWPFPNQDIIREQMRTYSYDNGNLTGNRGFCADGEDLTSYITGRKQKQFLPAVYMLLIL